MTYEHCDYPIGVNEIATLLDVKPSTVSQWGVRKNLPPVDALVGGGNTKLWRVETILNWASSTGRNSNDIKDCEQALSIIIRDMIDDTEKELVSANARWDRLSDDWNNYRKSMGLDMYQKDMYRNLGSYKSEEE
jgi:hypothetical protein